MIGSKVYHFEELGSTNDHASLLLSKKSPIEGTVVTTDHQSHGKGQYGRKWQTKAGQNITLSVILYPDIPAEDQFWLNMMASIAIVDLVEHFTDSSAVVKWPNDVYVDKAKISGILIQNFLSGAKIGSTIMGIGININQTEWPTMEKVATSISKLSNQKYDLEECRLKLYALLDALYPQMKSKDSRLKRRYVERLYGHQEIHQFEVNQEVVSGVIQGIDSIGRLVVNIDGNNHTYSMGEIRMIIE